MAWTLLVDFDGTGFNASDPTQVVTEYVQRINGRRGFRAFEHLENEQELTVILDNSSRRFSPEFEGTPGTVTSATAGYGVMAGYPGIAQYHALATTGGVSAPLAGKLLPNVPVQLLYDTVEFWTGWAYQWQPDTMIYGRRLCTLKCRGFQWLLKAQEIGVELYTNETADNIIADAIAASVVTLTGLPLWVLGKPGYSELGDTTVLRNSTAIGSFDEGESIIPLFGHNLNARDQEKKTTAAKVVQQALEHERGRLFTAADGTVTFLSRNAWTFNGTVDWSATNTSAATAYRDVNYYRDLAYLKNVVTVQGFGSEDGADTSATLYTLPAAVNLNAGQRRVIEVYITDDTQNVIAAKDLQPIVGGDVSWDGGTGTVGVKLIGQVLVIDINNPNSTAIRLTGLTVRGTEITSTGFKVSASDDSSIATYQRLEESITIKSMSDYDEVDSVARFELARRLDTAAGYADDLEFERGFDELSASDKLITSDIGTLIQLTEAQSGHSRKYRITGMYFALDSVSRGFDITYSLEPAYAGDVWQLDVSTLDNETVVGY